MVGDGVVGRNEMVGGDEVGNGVGSVVGSVTVGVGKRVQEQHCAEGARRTEWYGRGNIRQGPQLQAYESKYTEGST